MNGTELSLTSPLAGLADSPAVAIPPRGLNTPPPSLAHRERWHETVTAALPQLDLHIDTAVSKEQVRWHASAYSKSMLMMTEGQFPRGERLADGY
jgi:hypothetical protein